jgi:hypothetical protein
MWHGFQLVARRGRVKHLDQEHMQHIITRQQFVFHLMTPPDLCICYAIRDLALWPCEELF